MVKFYVTLCMYYEDDAHNPTIPQSHKARPRFTKRFEQIQPRLLASTTTVLVREKRVAQHYGIHERLIGFCSLRSCAVLIFLHKRL